ncbi:hypothetical protein [Streptomyces indicus]|uniref:Integral membrane protein n=1 Tax=Streptomyces indicus TaxID=417292 RepID=A0A1G8TJZ6_9ACTN|nr:hypothetical protein [Streptomyces indicus]SDJ41763.1 hypothetical protein SAMN05421806_101310 [Streptomyces indicus]
MAGSDEAVAADDDALYVLTAVLLTPAKFPSVLGDDYPEACAALGLLPIVDGYGLVLGQDSQGARWTVVIDDVSLVAVAIASWDCGMEYDLSPDDSTVVTALGGWPLEVAVAAPGVPAPHDPEPDPDDPDRLTLSPPDTMTWGPAQRRLGADEIALQWAMWRSQIDDSTFVTREDGQEAARSGADGERGAAGGPGAEQEGSASVADGTREDRPGALDTDDPADTDATTADAGAEDGEPGSDSDAPDPLTESGAVASAPDSGTASSEDSASTEGSTPTEDQPSTRTAIRRVLAEARAYIDTPPPLGRVRSAFATGEARTLRADGPGWSMVARTDDIAFVLLDEEPGEVLPVGRGPELPGLLEALDKMAVRPS